MQKKSFSRRQSRGTPCFSFEECIAKTDENGNPGLTVEQHCRIVGTVAGELVSLLPPSVASRLGTHPEAVAAFHDVGKVSPGFQKKIISPDALVKYCPELAEQPKTKYEQHHDAVGFAALNGYYGDAFSDHPVSVVAGMHHGGACKKKYNDIGGAFGGESWHEERTKLITRLESLFGTPDSPSGYPPLGFLAGLVSVADWIGSDETWFAPGIDFDERALGERVRNALKECGMNPPGYRDGLTFEQIFDFSPYPLQRQFIDSVRGPGLYILEAPMGMGKTEAALYAAYIMLSSGSARGLYFGLPTRLTSDMIHERVGDFLNKICVGRTDVRLAHGLSWLRAYERGGEAFDAGRSWFDSRKRALLHPFGVGTIDQALMAVLNVRHFFVRLYGLAGKVVILDEVHTYDMYTGTLLDLLVKWLLELNCTVIILSATLTMRRRAAFHAMLSDVSGGDGYPLISSVTDQAVSVAAPEPPPSKTVAITIGGVDGDGVAGEAVRRALSGECVLCIANTVGSAQEWYRLIKAAMPAQAFNVGLLHSKFPAFRRNEIELEWMKRLGPPREKMERPDGCILVATQVVEQSVDLDADSMITELAPTDMLLQRMGRLYRHNRPERPNDGPEFIIVAGDLDTCECADDLRELLGVSGLVYAPYVLWCSHGVWRDRSRVVLPDDVRDLLEATYRERGVDDEPAFVATLRQSLDDRKSRLRNMACAFSAGKKGMPEGNDSESAFTRYNDYPTLSCLLVRSLDSTGNAADMVLADGCRVSVDRFRKDMATTAKLHRNLVTLNAYGFSDTKRPEYLRRHFYDDTPVLVIGEDGRLVHNGNPTDFVYTNELGVARAPLADDGQTTHHRDYNDWEDYDEFDD